MLNNREDSLKFPPQYNTRLQPESKALKALSHYMGSAITGVCEVPDYAWYSHDKRGKPIEPYHKYALIVLIDQGYETFLGASGNDWISGSQSMRSSRREGVLSSIYIPRCEGE